MSTHQFTLSLGQVDFDALNTDEDFRSEARRLLPTVLAQVAEKVAETAWTELQKSLRGIPGMQVNSSSSEKQRFIQDAGRKFQREASAQDRQEIEDEIVSQLKEQKARKS